MSEIEQRLARIERDLSWIVSYLIRRDEPSPRTLSMPDIQHPDPAKRTWVYDGYGVPRNRGEYEE